MNLVMMLDKVFDNKGIAFLAVNKGKMNIQISVTTYFFLFYIK
jgi:hypothetical protein